MSQRHIDFVLEYVGQPCSYGLTWLEFLSDNVSYEVAYNTCPNFTWLAWFRGESLDENFREYIYLVRMCRLQFGYTTPLYSLPSLPDVLNDRFRVLYPWDRDYYGTTK